jgi:hypothetical protein
METVAQVPELRERSGKISVPEAEECRRHALSRVKHALPYGLRFAVVGFEIEAERSFRDSRNNSIENRPGSVSAAVVDETQKQLVIG